jgi:PHD/YefM family antitoxin component YafN of YafNO toxin-antitoxin module
MKNSDFENLNRLLKLIGGRFIIVEDGKPTVVLMSYQEFENLAAPIYEQRLVSRVDDINKEITQAQLLDLREEVMVDLPEEIRIEPLP